MLWHVSGVRWPRFLLWQDCLSLEVNYIDRQPYFPALIQLVSESMICVKAKDR